MAPMKLSTRMFKRSGLAIAGCVAISLATIVLSTSSASAQSSYYRVVNDKGIIELKSAISPDEVKRGYAIVTIGGHVIKEVPAELSEEEYALLSDELKSREQKAQQEKEAQAYNESLLLRYSAVEDLEAERRRKLAEFDVRASILRSNMLSLKDQVERQQSIAADIERAGREVPKVIRENIADLELKLNDAENSLSIMEEEKKAIDARYAFDIERFSTLIGKRVH